MTWRGSNTVQDRIFACLVYLLPILDLLLSPFGTPLFETIPALKLAIVPLVPILVIYSFSYQGLPIVSFAIFFGLFIGVVNNRELRHFLRFHAMQALVLSIFIFLCGAVFQLFGLTRGLVGSGSSAIETLFWNSIFSVIFLGVIAASLYSIVQAARGLYAEVPVISDAAYRVVG